MLKVTPIKTSIYKLNDDFQNFLREHLKPHIKENTIIAITSKVVSLAENRIVGTSSVDKEDLIKKEAEKYIGKTLTHDVHLTIKHNLLIPSAGIDESNTEGDFYILYPEDPFQSAQNICHFLKSEFGLTNLGVILTDSKTLPLRRGVVGASIGYSGFKGVESKMGEPDLFNKPLKFTCVDVVDSLANASTLLMGEAGEACPLALIEYDQANFTDQPDHNELLIPFEEDLYTPLLLKLRG